MALATSPSVRRPLWAIVATGAGFIFNALLLREMQVPRWGRRLARACLLLFPVLLALQAMVQRYQAHAKLEEQVFLPLAQTILGRNGNHMAALGLSLHMRHQNPSAFQFYG